MVEISLGIDKSRPLSTTSPPPLRPLASTFRGNLDLAILYVLEVDGRDSRIWCLCFYKVLGSSLIKPTSSESTQHKSWSEREGV